MSDSVRQSFHLDDDEVIASRGGRTLDAADLQSAAGAIGELLPVDARGEWCVSTESPFMLLAVLSALQAVGGTPLLLPHTRPALLAGLIDSCRGFISDGPLAIRPAALARTTALHLPDLDTLLNRRHAGGAIATNWLRPVGFMTSGSTGEPTRVFKTPEQLIAEIDVLEGAFGERISHERTFCGTTSHQHLYGFTFRLMWPLLTGRRLADAQIGIPGEVGAEIKRLEKIVLISSPAFLERAVTLLDRSVLRQGHLLGFSSGGPLAAEVAREFNGIEDVSLLEIYGSTETGALAWRITDREPAPGWQGLPGVSVRIEAGRLSVSGPHLSGPGYHLTEDLAEPAGDGFRLQGRQDQIVKVADKRVSLTELNRLLGEHPGVEDGRVVQLDDGALAGIVVPVEREWVDIEIRGKRTFCAGLRDRLAENVDRVTTPKRWRLLRALPRNTQGKLEREQLLALFDTPNDTPQWQTLESSEHQWLGAARIDDDLTVLDGHFPGHPIVPGVALVHWAVMAARSAFGLDSFNGSLQAVKFKSPVLPGTELTLALKHDAARSQVAYEYRNDQRILSSGRLMLHDH